MASVTENYFFWNSSIQKKNKKNEDIHITMQRSVFKKIKVVKNSFYSLLTDVQKALFVKFILF